jgi:TetR/AcrR family transcriptional regulator
MSIHNPSGLLLDNATEVEEVVMTSGDDKARVADEAQPRHERILVAAAEEFAAKGFAAARMDEVARKSGCNKQLIYYYFESKAALRNAVLERMVDQARPLWAAVADADLMEGLHQLFRRPGTTVNWSRLLAWEGVEFGDPGAEPDILLEGRRREAYRVQVGLLRRAQGSGQLAPDLDPEMLSILVSLLALSRSLIPQVIKLTTDLDPSGSEYADRLRTFADNLFLTLSAAGGGASIGEAG